MKKLKLFIITCTVFTAMFSMSSIAQTNNSRAIPQMVLTSFNAKYPGANVKSWKAENGQYIAKAIVDNQKCFVSFDQNGNWESTISKIHGTRNLPEAVNKTYNKMAYRSWHVFTVSKLVTPHGELYDVNIDDTNLQIDIYHQSVLTTNKTLEFKSNGTLLQIKDTSDEPAVFAAKSN
jgi:hypothetical protein